MRVINHLTGFQNAYKQSHIWTVYKGSHLMVAFKTRREAREWVKLYKGGA